MTHRATLALLDQLSSQITLVDAGARGGAASLWDEFGAQGRLICFEADAEECDRLNRPGNGTAYIPYALAEHDRGVEVHITAGPACSSVYPPKPELYERYPGLGVMRPERTIYCPSITLDQYCAQSGIAGVDAIKLDTQGSELDILRGSFKTLQSVSLIDIEVVFNALYDGQPLFCDVDRFLRDRGFVLWRLTHLAFCSTGTIDSASPVQLDSVASAAYQIIPQENGQLFWGDAHYVRREFATVPDAHLDREQALKAAILVGQQGYWDLALEILRKSGDRKLRAVLGTIMDG